MRTDYECVIITGATSAALKANFDIWSKGGQSYNSGMAKKIIVSVAMYNATDMIVIYYVP
jgi:hypothetical protein